MRITLVCETCGRSFEREVGQYNYANVKHGNAIRCSKKCVYAAKRTDARTPEQKVADKAAYDALYSEKNKDSKKIKRAAYYQRTVNREKEREIRKKRMPLHVEYCRRPEYRAKKKIYDRVHRAEQQYGEFAEAYLCILDIDAEIERRCPDNTELYRMKGTLNKTQHRRREYDRAYSNEP